jgi:hypothetical protein
MSPNESASPSPTTFAAASATTFRVIRQPGASESKREHRDQPQSGQDLEYALHQLNGTGSTRPNIAIRLACPGPVHQPVLLHAVPQLVVTEAKRLGGLALVIAVAAQRMFQNRLFMRIDGKAQVADGIETL